MVRRLAASLLAGGLLVGGASFAVPEAHAGLPHATLNVFLTPKECEVQRAKHQRAGYPVGTCFSLKLLPADSSSRSWIKKGFRYGLYTSL